jgi:hypothetical protein
MPLALPLLQQLQCRDSGFVQSLESQLLSGLEKKLTCSYQAPAMNTALATAAFGLFGDVTDAASLLRSGCASKSTLPVNSLICPLSSAQIGCCC